MHQASQSRTSRADLTTKDTNYKLLSSETSAQQAQYQNQASAWQPHPAQQVRHPSQSSHRYADDAHRSTHAAYNPASLPSHQSHLLNSAIMSAKIESSQNSQPVPCNQQQVMPTTAQSSAYEHQYQPQPPLSSSEAYQYAGASRMGAADLKKAGGKEGETNHGMKYSLDGFSKSGNITTD